MNKKKWLKLMLLVTVMMIVLVGCREKKTAATYGQTSSQTGTTQSDANQAATEATEEAGEREELLSGKHHVNIVIQDKGTISVELDADAAPITVTNFVKLAEEGFYDGVVFHRIIEGFMMQGGDPTGTGMGGAENNIKGEFAANGIENNLAHTRGAISMARSQSNDSASSQFFIMHQDADHLDGQYACFGYVTEGMDVVDDICENTKGGDYNGIIPEKNRPVIETIEVVD